MINVELDEEMDMPCLCGCGRWFDLHEGMGSLHSDKVVCYDCAEKELQEKERDEEITELKGQIEDAIITITDAYARLAELKVELPPRAVVFNEIKIITPVDSNYPKTEIFVGPADSGKTRRARELAEGKKAKLFNGRQIGYKSIVDNRFYFSDLDGTEELIVVDDVPLKFLYDFLCWLFDPNMMVDRQGQRPIAFRRPPMIITVECDDYELIGHSFQRRFSIVKFPEAAPDHWKGGQ